MAAYYNELDPYAAAWLRELIKAGEIADGVVDERSIADVSADDLRGFVQCHFFAGIGGWSLALRLAGWPDDQPVWTGSCPCQPFSVAGKGDGTSDSRHLWPVWVPLIRECRPPVVFGEQVVQAITHGWLDLVFDDLEAADYACAAADLPACSVGAAQQRQRLWFVAHALRERGRGGFPAGADAVDVDPRSEAARSGGRGRGTTVEPEPSPLVDGVPGRLAALRGYGNAIHPEVAAAFIASYCDAVGAV